MGRSGGGGGGRSSGGFGGGRSSGGFSGGGRSSGGGFSGGGGRSSGPRNNYGGGPRRDPGPRPRGGGMFFFGGPRYYGAPPPPGGRRRRSGLLSTIIVVLVMLSIVCCTMSAFIGTSNNYDTSYSSSVTENTTERTKLEGVVSKTDWYQDDLGWIRSPNQMISGLEDFYNQTGVQPYIAFIAYSDDYWKDESTFDTTAADEYLDEIYEEKFSDEGHFIFAYFACYNDSEDMDGEFRYLAGYSADTIMDNEALNIFEGYFNTYYYDTSLSIEQMISNTFSATADSIMSTPTNGWDFARIAIVVVGVVAVVIVIYLILKNKAKRDKEREEYTKEILDKPLETFGDEDLSDLEKKYK